MRRMFAVFCLLCLVPASAQETPPSEQVTRWLLKLGDLWQRSGPDAQAIIFFKVWSRRHPASDDLPRAGRALAELTEGPLSVFFACVGRAVTIDEPALLDGLEDASIEALLEEHDQGDLLAQTRRYFAFLQRLDAEPDVPEALDRLQDVYPEHVWLAEQRRVLGSWHRFGRLRKRLDKQLGELVPALEGLQRVRVKTTEYEVGSDGLGRPTVIDAWVLAHEDGQYEVFCDRLQQLHFEEGSEKVLVDGVELPFLPAVEDLRFEDACFARIAGGVKSYADRAEHRARGGLSFAAETLLQAWYAERRGRPALAVRLYDLAVVAWEKAGEGTSLRSHFASELEASQAAR